MERRNAKHLHNCIEWYKEKIEYNGNCKDMNKCTREFIEQFGDLSIPPQVIIEKKLVNYMKGVGLRFSKLKKDADVVAKKWQQEVDLWLRENNLTEKHYLEQLDRNQKKTQPVSPRLNGGWKGNQRNSGSDDRQNYQSSSSQEIESPDSQPANQRNENNNHVLNHHSFLKKSSSPMQLENPATRNLAPAEFNANLSIDPKEVTPSNKVQESQVKPDDRFCISLKGMMFKAVKRKEPISNENLSRLLYICKDLLNLHRQKYPDFVIDYMESLKSPASDQIAKVNSDSGDCTKSLNIKTEKDIDSTHKIHNSHNVPSTSQQGARDSSKNCPESKHDRKRKIMEAYSVAMAKALKKEEQPSQCSKNLPSTSQQGAVASSRSCPESKHDRKRKHTESTQSVVKSNEMKVEQQPTQDSKNWASMLQQGGMESSRACPTSKHEKRKHMESTQSVVKSKEMKVEQQPTQDCKNWASMMQQGEIESSRACPTSKHEKRKHMESTQSVVKSKEMKVEQQPTQDCKNWASMLQQGENESSRAIPTSKHEKKRKHMESSQSVVNIKESKEEQQPSQDSKLKHKLKTEYVFKGKESKEQHQLAMYRTLKCKETAQSVAKAYESKDEHQQAQDSKLKLDSRRVCATALEARNCDKNHIKKRDSPDQSAMLAITSSKKERSSLYHGGKKSEVLKLKDLCIRSLHKGIKQNSDPTKYINKHVDFEIIEPVLVLMSPEKLQKLEEEMKYLKDNTDGVWHLCCEKKFKSQLHLKKKNENWRTFYQRCGMESDEKLRNITASISASASKAKPDRQIKFTTVDGPPTKRQKADNAMAAKNNANNLAVKPLPNSSHPSNSRSDAPVPPKGISNHTKSSHKPIKKDAPLMHKAKKTMGQLHRIHRN